ncbi:MAG: tetratricopeptide repeat protein [Acidobacteria bacterium]|nr:tetratricopeptide repeat protein [Acidobacteriota bacterium]
MAKGRVTAQNLKRDPLMQQYINTSIWVRGRSRPILRWLTVAAIVIAAALIVWLIFSRRASNAAASLSMAFSYHNAIVQNPLPASLPPGSQAFTTEDEKHRKAFEAFERAARDYPSYNGDMARYFAAAHQLYFEPEKAEATLKELSQKDSEIGAQARFALAQRYEVSGKYDEAIAEFQKLKSKPHDVPLPLIDINVAKVYEAQGKSKEAIDLYFSVAGNKDYRSTALGTTALNRLTILAPEKVDQLPPAEPPNPFSGLGGLGGFQ